MGTGSQTDCDISIGRNLRYISLFYVLVNEDSMFKMVGSWVQHLQRGQRLSIRLDYVRGNLGMNATNFFGLSCKHLNTITVLKGNDCWLTEALRA